MSKLSTWLWFDGNGEEAAQFYARLFGGEVTDIQRYRTRGPQGPFVFSETVFRKASF